MTRNVKWALIDRPDYNSFYPPHSALYTGLSLGHTFVGFLVLMLLQLTAITVVKIITVKKTKKLVQFWCAYFGKYKHFFSIQRLGYR